MKPTSSQQNKKSKFILAFKYKVWLAVIVFIIILFFAWRNAYVKAFIYNMLTNHHAPGNKLYVDDRLIANKKFSYIELYQLVRPITKEDIEVMSIPPSRKTSMNMNLRSQRQNIMITSDWAVSCDSLRKMHTAVTGTYTGYKACELRYKNLHAFGNFYSMLPDKKILIKLGLEDYFKIPEGYVLADSVNFYVLPHYFKN